MTTSSAIATGASSTPSHHMRVASHPARRINKMHYNSFGLHRKITLGVGVLFKTTIHEQNKACIVSLHKYITFGYTNDLLKCTTVSNV